MSPTHSAMWIHRARIANQTFIDSRAFCQQLRVNWAGNRTHRSNSSPEYSEYSYIDEVVSVDKNDEYERPERHLPSGNLIIKYVVFINEKRNIGKGLLSVPNEYLCLGPLNYYQKQCSTDLKSVKRKTRRPTHIKNKKDQTAGCCWHFFLFFLNRLF